MNAKPKLAGCDVLPPLDSPQRPTPAKPKPKGHKATGERFAVLNGFVDCSLAGLSRAELATWLVLYRDIRNGTACTSAGDISHRIGTSLRGVFDAIGRLRRRGLVVQVFQGGINRGPSRYRVFPLATPPDCKVKPTS